MTGKQCWAETKSEQAIVEIAYSKVRLTPIGGRTHLQYEVYGLETDFLLFFIGLLQEAILQDYT